MRGNEWVRKEIGRLVFRGEKGERGGEKAFFGDRLEGMSGWLLVGGK